MNKTFKAIRKEILDSCEQCKGQGWYNDTQGLQVPCECMRELFAVAMCDKGAVPVEYWRYNLNQFPGNQSVLSEICALVQAWLDTGDIKNLSFVLSGGYRVGKTSLAVALAKFYNKCNQDATIYYITARDLESSVFTKEQKELQLAYESDFLIVDDLSKETTFNSSDPGKRVIRGVLDQVIRHRRNYKPTVITTNLNKQNLASHYGGNLGLIFENDFNFIQWPENSEKLNIKGL